MELGGTSDRFPFVNVGMIREKGCSAVHSSETGALKVDDTETMSTELAPVTRPRSVYEFVTVPSSCQVIN